MARLVSSSGCWFWLATTVLAFAACDLNPQPDDTWSDPSTGGEAMSSSGGKPPASGGTSVDVGGNTSTGGQMPGTGGTTAAGGTGAGGLSHTGGASTAGASGVDPICIGDAEDTFIDDAADCDLRITLGSGLEGEWFAYDSGPELDGTLNGGEPEAFTMSVIAGSDCAARAYGGGYPYNEADGFGYVGIGIALQTFDGQVCAEGFDAAAFSGLTFSARGRGAISVIIETMESVNDAGRPNGYVADFELGNDWQVFSLSWSELALLDQTAGAPAVADAEQIRSIRFEPHDPADFDFSIDDVAFVAPPSGGGGQGGAGSDPGGGGAQSQSGSPTSG